MKLSNLKLNMFRPEALLVYYLLFLVIAAVSFFAHLPMKKPTALGFAITLLSFPFYLIGVKLSEKIYSKKIPPVLYFAFAVFLTLFYAGVFAGFYKISMINGFFITTLAIFVPLAALYRFSSSISKPVSSNIPKILMLIGVLSLFLAFLEFGGIPLLNPALKIKALTSAFWGIAILTFFTGYAIFLSSVKNQKTFFAIVLLSTLLFSLMAFRGGILTVFLTGIIIAYYKGFLGNKKVFLGLAVALFIIIGVGYIAMPLLDPLKLLFYRAGTTYIVFDKIVQQSFPFGITHGSLFFHGDPRIFVGFEIMGKTSATSLTYTLIGSAAMDFGILGVVLWMLFLGLILGLAYRSKEHLLFRSFYALMFSLSFIGIETGLDPFQLLFFWSFLFLWMAKNNRKE